MTGARVGDHGFDRDAYDRANKAMRLVRERLAEPEIEALALEVVRRLAFRMPRKDAVEGLPGREEIELLCAALISTNEYAADRILMAARRDGVSVENIYMGYVIGAARRLGKMWEDDTASFVEVTLGSARLFRIIRGLRKVLAPVITEGREVRPAMFALVPGETHSLGIEIATDMLRQDGWNIDMVVDKSHDGVMALAEERAYEVIVLVANSGRMVAAMTQMVLGLRIVQPLAKIAIAGNIVSQETDIHRMVTADAVITNIAEAANIIRGLQNARD